ncbi:MAG TPA: hypothetical protein VFF77_09745, partial [Holophagaceae bacterium]|nr:hypothetical protein [Holophagaceae bacterium]
MPRRSAALALLFAPSFMVPLAAQSTLAEALAGAKLHLEVRGRYEHVEDAAGPKTANAPTVRTVLGLTTAPLKGIQATLDFANVAAIGDERYNSGLNGHTQYASVQDPGQTQVLQAYLQGYGFKMGRQILSFDNQRFIGPGAWSQMPKTFTAALFENATWIPHTEFTVGHLFSIHTSLGVNRGLSGELARLRWFPDERIALTPFWYGIDEITKPPTSYQHLGLRADGAFHWLTYEASVAQQRAYQDGLTPRRMYRMGSIGAKGAAWAARYVEERLEGGFQTPLSSLHGFYGWSDRIGTTPAGGLVDRYAQGTVKAGAFDAEAQAHRFNASQDGLLYGRELDLSLGWKAAKGWTLLAAIGRYWGDAGAPAAGSLDKNLS